MAGAALQDPDPAGVAHSAIVGLGEPHCGCGREGEEKSDENWKDDEKWERGKEGDRKMKGWRRCPRHILDLVYACGAAVRRQMCCQLAVVRLCTSVCCALQNGGLVNDTTKVRSWNSNYV